MSNEIGNTERRVIAWIGKAVRVEGKVISEEDLTIDGDVEGSIELGGHSLTIGQDGQNQGGSAGQNRDDQRQGDRQRSKAVEKVDLRATGSVDGDITAPRFVMAEGATVMGKVQAG